MNVSFAALLEQRKAQYRFDHRTGDHTWDFWDRSLQDCLEFFFGKK